VVVLSFLTGSGPRPSRAAWLLIIVATIGSVLFGRAVADQRRAVRSLTARARLFQIQYALQCYAQAFETLPPLRTTPSDGGEGLSWRVLILPFLNESELYSRFDLTRSWDAPENAAWVAAMPVSLFAPASGGPVGHTSFVAVNAQQQWLYQWNPTGFVSGSGSTLSLIEIDSPVIWTQPRDWNLTRPGESHGAATARRGIRADGSDVWLSVELRDLLRLNDPPLD